MISMDIVDDIGHVDVFLDFDVLLSNRHCFTKGAFSMASIPSVLVFFVALIC